jgi:CrcB protein
MMKFLLVAIGGGVGAVLRYWLSSVVNQAAGFHAFPFGTVVVNLIGSFVIGLLAGIFERMVVPQDLRIFLLTGILGGFTTFSSFGLETALLFRDEKNGLAVANIIVSNAMGVTMVVLGFMLSNLILRPSR